MNRARVVTLNAALGPLDYRVPDGMHVEPGSVLVAPLGPRQLLGVAWEAERLPTEEVGENRLRPIVGTLDVPPIAAPLRRLAEWTADYYLAPLASVLRMILPSSSALEGPRQLTEYRPTGHVPDRMTPQRLKALAALEGRQGTIRELAAFVRPRSPPLPRRLPAVRMLPPNRLADRTSTYRPRRASPSTIATPTAFPIPASRPRRKRMRRCARSLGSHGAGSPACATASSTSATSPPRSS